MSTLQLLILCITIVSGSAFIISVFKSKTHPKYLFSLLTTFSIIIIAILQESGSFFLYKNLILAGMAFALIGEVLLILPKWQNSFGGVSFIIALILFIIAFAVDPGPYLGWGYLIPAAVYAIIFLALFLKRSGEMIIPVIVFVILMSLLLWQASGRAWYLAEEGVLLSLTGTILLIINSTMLAYDRFIKSFRLATVLYMSLYWLALLLISVSI